MGNTDTITHSIIQTYLHGTEVLTDKLRFHFAYRAFLATQNPEQWKYLETTFTSYIDNAYKFIHRYHNDYETLLKEEMNELQRSKETETMTTEKKKLLQAHPEITLLNKLLHHYYHLELCRRNFTKIPISKELLESVKKTILHDEEFIRYCCVICINITSLAKNLHLFNIEDAFVQSFQHVYQKSDLENYTVFKAYVYGLTHIILGASYFYKFTVDKDTYKWVFDIYDRMQHIIFEKLTLDINIEVALCYWLAGIARPEFTEKVKARVIKNFSETDGYIHREGKNYFSYAEHMNSIAILLFNKEHIPLTHYGK